MSQRFFVYPVALIVVMQLVPLLRDWRWYAAQIIQHTLILITAAGAMFFDGDIRWVVVAWALPRLMNDSAQIIRDRPASMLGLGVLIAFLTPTIATVLFFTPTAWRMRWAPPMNHSACRDWSTLCSRTAPLR